MSSRAVFGLKFVERIIAIAISIIGVILAYYTYTNQSSAGWSTGYFIAAGIFLVILGLFMLIAKTE